MIVISGQVESKDLIANSKTRQIGIQEANIREIVKPITKHSKVLNKNSDIEFELSNAIKISEEGRPGPVWIDVPLDVQSANFKKKNKKLKKLKKNKSGIKSNKIDKALKIIKNSKRPLILVGNGVHLSKAERKFLSFLNKTKIPFLSTWNASDIAPSNHQLYFGRPGLFGNRISNFAIQACDSLLILGSRLSVPITGYQMKNFSPFSKKIFVDIDNREMIKRKIKLSMKFNNDVGIFLDKISARIKNKLNPKNSWIKKLKELKKYLNEDSKYNNEDKKFINSFSFIKSLSDSLKGNENIVTDMGTSFTCTMQSFKTKKKQRLFTSSGIAAMGFGLPGILGAYFADKKKIPICITGDGGLMFNIQELHTFINYKVPVKIFIINNGGYLTMKLMQKKNFKKFVGADDKSGLTLPRFLNVAKAFGFRVEKLTNQKKLDKKLQQILKSKKATVCEIMIPPMQELIPRVQTQMNKDGSFEPAMLDNMYPFLEKEALKKIQTELLLS